MSVNVENCFLQKNPGENVGNAAAISTFKATVFENLVAKISAIQPNPHTVFIQRT